jgi:hypothetical protein
MPRHTCSVLAHKVVQTCLFEAAEVSSVSAERDDNLRKVIAKTKGTSLEEEREKGSWLPILHDRRWLDLLTCLNLLCFVLSGVVC